MKTVVLCTVLFHILLTLCCSVTGLNNDTAQIRATDCQIDIRQLNERHPLFLDLRTQAIRYPDLGTSIITLRPGESLELDCPGAGNIQVGDEFTGEISTATCVSDWNFRVLSQVIDLKEVVCTSRITSVARYTGRSCWGSYKEIEVGFQIVDGRFLFEMSVCFDDVQRNVIYSYFQMSKQIGAATTGNTRPSWTEGNFYNLGMRLNNLYTNAIHRATINRQLGLAEDDTKYVKPTGHYYYARGHLTARTDYIYNAQQQATHHYINSVPQWQTFNGYNWFYFERNLRILAANNFVDLEVYTGTYGISTLPHEQTGRETPLYFYFDENGNTGIPIPELFWKVAYDPVNKAGVAVLGINNPYQQDVQRSIICNDIADQLTWLTFDRTRIETGYLYACTIDDLRRLIPQIPRFDVQRLLN